MRPKGMIERKWFNIGSRSEYLEVHRTISKQRWKPLYVKAPQWPERVAASAIVDPSAQIRGCSVVGENCVIGAGVVLDDTIVWPDAQIVSRSRLRNCIVRSRQKVDGEFNDLDL